MPEPDLQCSFRITMLACLIIALSTSQELSVADLFRGVQGCFVLRNVMKSETRIFNKDQAMKRLSPYSTFKIPNTVIAFESNVVKSPSQSFEWQGEVTVGRPELEHNMNLDEAFRISCVWVYQRIARKIGRQRYVDVLKRLRYGNQDVSGPIDRFWLASTLKISAVEQTEFLTKLLTNQFGIRPSSLACLEKVAVQSSGKDWILASKTGSARAGLSWNVGWIRSKRQLWTFALNLEGPGANRTDAIRITQEILRRKGLID